MNKREFFYEISKNCNFVDEKSVEDMYYAMIRVIGRQLRDKKKINMPDFGQFRLHRHKPRMALNVRSKQIENLGAKTTIKFTPIYKLKAYFHDMPVF